ncbi:MAG: HD domain-containing protein [Magnetococcus sp. WYHC-3]
MPLERQRSELIEESARVFGPEGAAQVAQAVAMAEAFHRHQVRKSDNLPYVTHCLSVAQYCLRWGLHDLKAVQAALLHDAIEDAPAEMKAESVIAAMDPEVASIVLALSKIRSSSGDGDMAGTYRRVLTAASRDLRVLIVKLFDVMHNSETLGVHPPAKAKNKASLGLVYVGVARRLGMILLADALIELLVPHLMPVQSKRAMEVLEELHVEGRPAVDRLREAMAVRLREPGRPEPEVLVEQRILADYFSLSETPGTGTLSRISWPCYRMVIMVSDSDEAWQTLGRVHRYFDPLPRHIRDYMSAPRINGFRSLTTRVLWEGHPVNVQVARRCDDAANRMGILAKWGETGPDPKRYMALLATLGDSDLRMSEVHAHVLPDTLDVYTPTGDRLTFPRGSIVVDFAFLVHTDLGMACTGARVNGVRVGPEHELADGDVVQVITSRNTSPQRAWLNLVKTARARTLIKQALRDRVSSIAGLIQKDAEAFAITDLSGPDLFWSPCCLPVPPQGIRGRLSNDGHWIVHRSDCPNLQRSQERWQEGAWELKSHRHIMEITLSLLHRPGALLSVLELLARHGINGHSVHSKGHGKESLLLEVELGGGEPMLLGRVLHELRSQLPAVREIRKLCWKNG